MFKDMIAGAAQELARTENKKGRARSLSPCEVGERAAGGDLQALAWWNEYTAATKGVHRIRWARGLRERLGMSPEMSDEALLEADESDRVVCDLDDTESAVLLFAPELVPLVCESAERGGADEVHRVLRAAWEAFPPLDRARIKRWARGRTIGGV